MAGSNALEFVVACLRAEVSDSVAVSPVKFFRLVRHNGRQLLAPLIGVKDDNKA